MSKYAYVMEYMNESRHILSCHVFLHWAAVLYEWVVSNMNKAFHVRMSHVTYECLMAHMHESCQYEWDISHMNQSWHLWISDGTYEGVMSRVPAQTLDCRPSEFCWKKATMLPHTPTESEREENTQIHTQRHIHTCERDLVFACWMPALCTVFWLGGRARCPFRSLSCVCSTALALWYAHALFRVHALCLAQALVLSLRTLLLARALSLDFPHSLDHCIFLAASTRFLGAMHLDDL